MFQLQLFCAPLWRMGPRCSSAETQVCHRSYIIAAMISQERRKDWEVFTTSGTYPWSFVTQIFHNVNQVMMATVKLSKWWLQLNCLVLRRRLWNIKFAHWSGLFMYNTIKVWKMCNSKIDVVSFVIQKCSVW